MQAISDYFYLEYANILKKVTNPEKGNNYKITVNVIPSYLYQLSDDDVKVELSVEDS